MVRRKTGGKTTTTRPKKLVPGAPPPRNANTHRRARAATARNARIRQAELDAIISPEMQLRLQNAAAFSGRRVDPSVARPMTVERAREHQREVQLRNDRVKTVDAIQTANRDQRQLSRALAGVTHQRLADLNHGVGHVGRAVNAGTARSAADAAQLRRLMAQNENNAAARHGAAQDSRRAISTTVHRAGERAAVDAQAQRRLQAQYEDNARARHGQHVNLIREHEGNAVDRHEEAQIGRRRIAQATGEAATNVNRAVSRVQQAVDTGRAEASKRSAKATDIAVTMHKHNMAQHAKGHHQRNLNHLHNMGQHDATRGRVSEGNLAATERHARLLDAVRAGAAAAAPAPGTPAAAAAPAARGPYPTPADTAPRRGRPLGPSPLAREGGDGYSAADKAELKKAMDDADAGRFDRAARRIAKVRKAKGDPTLKAERYINRVLQDHSA